MNAFQLDPLTFQAMAGSGLGNSYLGQQLAPYYQNVYGGKVGGNTHLVSTDRDATRQAEAAAGMPVAVQTLPNGLAKPKRVRLTIDTMAQLADGGTPSLLTIKLWDLGMYFQNSPQTMSASNISTLPTISLNGEVGLYNSFVQRLFSQTIYIVGMLVEVNASENCSCHGAFPAQLKQNIKHTKINEDQMIQDDIWLSDMRNPMAQSNNLGSIGLTGSQQRLDRDTTWIWKVYTGQVITIDLLIATYEHSS